MGIVGLLPALKPIVRPSNISKFAGKAVAVDTYSWMHKACYGYAESMISDPNNLKWISYCMNYIDMILSHGIVLYLVFDGGQLPAKEKTEALRATSRVKNTELAKEKADKSSTLSRAHMARSIDVTPRMAAQLIRACRQHRPSVKCIVAPYEADAQLSYLCATNVVDVVISEDSDCVPYMCKEILFKLDNKSGYCEHLIVKDLFEEKNDSLDLRQFSRDMVVTMCTLTGCDYLASPVGYGIKKSHRLVSKQRTPARVLRTLRFEGAMPLQRVVEADSVFDMLYELQFYKAMMTFYHQTVFCMHTKQTVPLTPFPVFGAEGSGSQGDSVFPATLWAAGVDLSFLGALIEDATLACAIADGLVDPVTRERFNLPEPVAPPLTATRSASATRLVPHSVSALSSAQIERRHTIGTVSGGVSSSQTLSTGTVKGGIRSFFAKAKGPSRGTSRPPTGTSMVSVVARSRTQSMSGTVRGTALRPGAKSCGVVTTDDRGSAQHSATVSTFFSQHQRGRGLDNDGSVGVKRGREREASVVLSTKESLAKVSRHSIEAARQRNLANEMTSNSATGTTSTASTPSPCCSSATMSVCSSGDGSSQESPYDLSLSPPRTPSAARLFSRYAYLAAEHQSCSTDVSSTTSVVSTSSCSPTEADIVYTCSVQSQDMDRIHSDPIITIVDDSDSDTSVATCSKVIRASEAATTFSEFIYR